MSIVKSPSTRVTSISVGDTPTTLSYYPRSRTSPGRVRRNRRIINRRSGSSCTSRKSKSLSYLRPRPAQPIGRLLWSIAAVDIQLSLPPIKSLHRPMGLLQSEQPGRISPIMDNLFCCTLYIMSEPVIRRLKRTLLWSMTDMPNTHCNAYGQHLSAIYAPMIAPDPKFRGFDRGGRYPPARGWLEIWITLRTNLEAPPKVALIYFASAESF